jgi:hypothetical protein
MQADDLAEKGLTSTCRRLPSGSHSRLENVHCSGFHGQRRPGWKVPQASYLTDPQRKRIGLRHYMSVLLGAGSRVSYHGSGAGVCGKLDSAIVAAAVRCAARLRASAGER